MKKIISSLAMGAILATTASADIGRVEMGVGIWSQAQEGSASYIEGLSNGEYNSLEDNEMVGYVWALVKHPIPIIPNLKVEYTTVSDNGSFDGAFENFGQNGVTTTGDIMMKQFDIIPYYNILDNTFWITIDVGLDFKIIQSEYDIKNGQSTDSDYISSESVVIPMLYARGRTQLPTTNLGFEADVKYISYDETTMYDARAKIDYTLDIFPIIQPAIEVGYRVQKFDVEVNNANTILEFSGVYAGIMARF